MQRTPKVEQNFWGFNMRMGKPSDMTIAWCGTLAVLLARLKRRPYEVTRVKHDETERIKRLGVYYMCIDDLPL